MELRTELRTPDVTITAEMDRLGDEIAELSAHLDAASARLLDLIREFDARGGWNNGFRSCAAWLTWRVGLAPGAAREHVRVARALGTLPRLAQALAHGELSYSKVRELSRVATPETEERLLAVGRAGTAEHVVRIVCGWRRMDRKAEEHEAARRHASRALHVYPDDDGTVRVPRSADGRDGRAAREGAGRRAGSPVPATTRASAGSRLSDDGAATSRRPGAARRGGAASRARSWRSRGALSGRGPRRCRRTGGLRCAWPISLRGRRARSSWNVSAPGVRRQPGRHATRLGRANNGDRRPNPHDSAGAAAGSSLSRRRLPLSRLWHTLRPGPSYRSLGPRRPHYALESRSAMSPAPSRGPRGGFSSRSTAKWRAAIPSAGWPTDPRCPAAARGAG
jgi:hypothetical protein